MLRAVATAISWMTVIPTGLRGAPDRTTAGHAITALPVVGLLCGLLAVTIGHGLVALGAIPVLSGVAGVAAVLVLTRGMHVDALADTADALGSYAGPERALAIMRSGSIGPMGVAAVVTALLVESAALGQALVDGSWVAPVAAFVLARCLPAVLCRRGVPAAAETGFGALVAGSQGRRALIGVTVVALLCGAGMGIGVVPASLARIAWTAPAGLAVAAALLGATALLGRHVVRRLGGITGDVLGAVIEAGTAAGLLAAALLT